MDQLLRNMLQAKKNFIEEKMANTASERGRVEVGRWKEMFIKAL